MPREQFFLDKTEDTIHSNKIEITTAKEKRANWWFYHKVHLIVGALLVALVFSFVYSMFTKVESDYVVSLLTTKSYSSDVIQKLQDNLQQYADDRNGDGKVVVTVSDYAIGSDDIQTQQANVVRLMGDTSTFESAVFLVDQDAFEWMEKQGGFFVYNDGSTPKEGASDYENMQVSWTDCKALTEMDLSIDILSKEEAQKYMSNLVLSMRIIEGTGFADDEEKRDYYEDSRVLYERLISGEKVSTETKSE